MKTIKDIKESSIIEDYVFGNPSEEQIKLVQQYILKYPELKTYITSLEDTATNIASENEIKPPLSWKSDILDRATSSQHTEPASRDSKSSTSSWMRLIAAGLLGALLVGLLMFTKMKQLKTELTQSKEQYVQLEAECNKEQLIYANNQQILDYLQDEDTQLHTLKNNLPGNEDHVSIFWNDAQRRAMATVKSLQALNSDETYQLWADVNGEMISIALFTGEDHHFQDIKHLENISSLNITIEPAGGSQHPTVSRLILSTHV